MKKLIILAIILCPFSLKAQYIPLRNTMAEPIIQHNLSFSVQRVIVSNGQSNSVPLPHPTGKLGFRNEMGQLRYEQYNSLTNEIDITDSLGNDVGYLVPISIKNQEFSNPKIRYNILDSNRIYQGYLIQSGRIIKKYDIKGRLVKKVKVR